MLLGWWLDLRGLERFVNNNLFPKVAQLSGKYPKFLAWSCNSLLKKSSKNPAEAELEDMLNQVTVAFKDMENKDVLQSSAQSCWPKDSSDGTAWVWCQGGHGV